MIDAKELRDKYPAEFEREYIKWCEHEPYDDWYEFVFEGAKERGKEKGFDIEGIYFTGFWSQGDGASWSGSVDILKYIEANNLQADPMWFAYGELIRDGVAGPAAHVSARNSHYSHSNTMQITFDCSDLHADSVMERGVLAGALVNDVVEAIDFEKAERWMLEDAKGYADEIYDDLREDYEHLTSEESFLDYCHANDVEFDVDEEECTE